MLGIVGQQRSGGLSAPGAVTESLYGCAGTFPLFPFLSFPFLSFPFLLFSSPPPLKLKSGRCEQHRVSKSIFKGRFANPCVAVRLGGM